MQRILACLWLAIAAGFLGLIPNAERVFGQDYPNCSEFGTAIPHVCCCTNDCCTEAPSTEFEQIGADLYRSTVTGQIVKRTGWSAGGYVKCACDLIDGKWTKHPRANIRCLFAPMPSS